MCVPLYSLKHHFTNAIMVNGTSLSLMYGWLKMWFTGLERKYNVKVLVSHVGDPGLSLALHVVPHPWSGIISKHRARNSPCLLLDMTILPQKDVVYKVIILLLWYTKLLCDILFLFYVCIMKYTAQWNTV